MNPSVYGTTNAYIVPGAVQSNAKNSFAFSSGNRQETGPNEWRGLGMVPMCR